ncbi:uncharacterized protein LOC108228049 isoform X3 [Daucus carota subsp. sativus]|uniref:uncharacterized protein LOC108228049 isoform X3 n=1 Tax=Daucus carota subsp. sativus TaxID=79200 RepID=UPI0030828357
MARDPALRFGAVHGAVLMIKLLMERALTWNVTMATWSLSSHGIGAVIRNSRGKIVRMLSGSLGIQNRRINEYQALLESCKRSFVED